MIERTENTSRISLIRRASFIALFGNAALAIMKIVTGFLSGSLAVVGDGIDSSTDVAIAVMSLVVASVIDRPADKEHPWGHARAETIATTGLAFVLFFAGSQLVLQAVRDLLGSGIAEIPRRSALIVTAVSIVGKLILAATQFRLGKRAGSSMIIANAKNMRGDVLISAAVFIGLGFSILLGLPQADPITALLVGLWVIRSAVGIFKEVNLELMDGSQDRGPYQAIFEAVRSVPGAGNPHRARMRRIASSWDIDLDIEVDGSMKVKDAHNIAIAVERAIKERIDNVYDIVVHVEPSGENGKHEENECFGLSEADMEKEGGDGKAGG